MNTSLKELVIFCCGVCLFFTIALGSHNSNKEKQSAILQQELKEKEPWLHSELHDIDVFLEHKHKQTNFTNRKVRFSSNYISPEYDEQKLRQLYQYLISKGWQDVTPLMEENFIRTWTNFESQPAIENTHILCKNKATLFFYQIDLKDDYHIKPYKKVSTAINIYYDSSFPCYTMKTSE